MRLPQTTHQQQTDMTQPLAAPRHMEQRNSSPGFSTHSKLISMDATLPLYTSKQKNLSIPTVHIT
jgi:hypothetical protein